MPLRTLGASILCLALVAGCENKPTASGSAADPSKADPKPSLSVTSDELYEAFAKDQKAAAAKYDGQVIELTGPVGAIRNRGYDRERGVVIRHKGVPADRTARSLQGIQCSVTDPKIVGAMGIGQVVKLTGKFRSSGNVLMLDGAKITDAGRDACLRPGLEEFVAKFEANPKEAAKEFDDRTIVLTGKVKSLAKGELDFQEVVLESKAGTIGHVIVLFSLEKAKFAVGDTVTLAGAFDGYDDSKKKVKIGEAMVTE